jgi:two-component system, NtrC family, sensor kinase
MNNIQSNIKNKITYGKNISIMIVDDSVTNIEILSSALKEWGYRVRPAINGKQALLAARNEPPDLILLDILMPDMDGYEICRRLKEDPVTREIPVIFISALDKMFDEVKGFSLGAVDYITKPVILPVLKSRIDTHIQLKFHQDNLENIVLERTREINSLLSSIKTVLIGVSKDNIITHWNNEAEIVFKVKSSDAAGKEFNNLIINWDWLRVNEGILNVLSQNEAFFLKELRFLPSGSPEGSNRYLNLKVTPLKDIKDKITGYLISGEDITEVRSMRIHSNQAQKMEAIGQLAAGIAHEINTPAQYIRDNTLYIKEALNNIFNIINKFINLHKDINTCNRADEIFALIKSSEYDFIIEEIPKAIDQTIEGIGRITKISNSIKQFSHPGISVQVLSDINKIIDEAVTISKNEWKYVSNIIHDLDENIKKIECYPDEISQVFLNLIINAAHAIEEKHKKNSDMKGIIKISTRNSGANVKIKFSDTGNGISEENIEKIFDPFFTTKDIGKGTGQGLAIAYNVIVNRHKGHIDVISIVGAGTTFTITLPINTVAEGIISN